MDVIKCADHIIDINSKTKTQIVDQIIGIL